MFSRKTVIIFSVIVLLAVSIIFLSATTRDTQRIKATGTLTLFSPIQFVVTRTLRFFSDSWRHYFHLISAAEENVRLKRELGHARARNNRQQELEYANIRLRKLLKFRQPLEHQFLSAEVIARDPSAWYKTVTIDKGWADGVHKGLPVVISEGIAGQVIEATARYAKVMLLIDRNSAVDALVQRTRARGIIKGAGNEHYQFVYVLRKDETQIGDRVITSGLDGVFPKGLVLGQVATVEKQKPGIFQSVTVQPAVDFDKLEEVLVLLNPNGKPESLPQ